MTMLRPNIYSFANLGEYSIKFLAIVNIFCRYFDDRRRRNRF